MLHRFAAASATMIQPRLQLACQLFAAGPPLLKSHTGNMNLLPVMVTQGRAYWAGMTSPPVVNSVSVDLGARGPIHCMPAPRPSLRPVQGCAAALTALRGSRGMSWVPGDYLGYIKSKASSLPGLSIGQTTNNVGGLNIYHRDSDFAARKDELIGRMYQVYNHRGKAYDLGDVQRIYLMLCMAMAETDTMRTRDTSKDWDGNAANVSCFNVNIDFLNHYGFPRPSNYDTDDNLWDVISCIDKSFDVDGIFRSLNFHRGGRTGYNDPNAYMCQEYRDGIATMYYALVNDPSILSDDRRIAVPLQHV